MNSVCLIGRLTRDPEIRTTPAGKTVGTFTLAVDRAGDRDDSGSYAAGFFDCECWEKQAEILSQYVGKGRQIGIEGRLRLHKWQAQDGANRSKVEIVVSRISFADSKPEGQQGGGSGQFSGQFVPASTDADFQGTDDDIPF